MRELWSGRPVAVSAAFTPEIIQQDGCQLAYDAMFNFSGLNQNPHSMDSHSLKAYLGKGSRTVYDISDHERLTDGCMVSLCRR